MQLAFGANASGPGAIVGREFAILGLTLFLLWIVRARERRSLGSIGIHFEHLAQSIAWGSALAVICFAAVFAVLAIYSVLGVRYGEGPPISRSLPVALLTVVRAGISEEVFYRGFAIGRLEALTGKTWLAAAISLVAFAGFHFHQGIAGVVLALVLGGIITCFFVWNRNLMPAIFAHLLVDFVPNVLVPLLGGA